jgi:hypothetical protein
LGCIASQNSAFCADCGGTVKSGEKADVAQLVEQPIRNRQVTGSSPVVGSRKRDRSRPFAGFFHFAFEQK